MALNGMDRIEVPSSVTRLGVKDTKAGTMSQIGAMKRFLDRKKTSFKSELEEWRRQPPHTETEQSFVAITKTIMELDDRMLFWEELAIQLSSQVTNSQEDQKMLDGHAAEMASYYAYIDEEVKNEWKKSNRAFCERWNKAINEREAKRIMKEEAAAEGAGEAIADHTPATGRPKEETCLRPETLHLAEGPRGLLIWST